MATDTKKPATLVITGLVRFGYATIQEPKAMKPGDKPKYSIMLYIPKTDRETLAKIKAAYEAAKELGKKKHWHGEIPEDLKIPLRDGDKPKKSGKKDEAAKGCYFMSASAYAQPNCIDAKGQTIAPVKIYSGCYGRASINIFPYNYQGMSQGIGVGLNNLEFRKDGIPLGGRNTAEYDFSLEQYEDDEEEESDDFLD